MPTTKSSTTLDNFDVYRYYEGLLHPTQRGRFYVMCVAGVKEYYIKHHLKLVEPGLEFDYNTRDGWRLLKIIHREYEACQADAQRGGSAIFSWLLMCAAVAPLVWLWWA
jgi:hypothetical protein